MSKPVHRVRRGGAGKGGMGRVRPPDDRTRMSAVQAGVEAANSHRPTNGDDHVDLSLRVTVQVETLVGAVVRRNDGDRRLLPNSVVGKPIREAQGWARLCPAAAQDRRQADEKKRAHPNESQHSVRASTRSGNRGGTEYPGRKTAIPPAPEGQPAPVLTGESRDPHTGTWVRVRQRLVAAT